ncbi:MULTISPECIES: CU044_5270 family protein [unclassified Spirillospora]|uniref:CU044_5270 family protein n=1 Tax=unclassified Spirillospora TaxID=2642701 RepID=UPI0037126A14
MTIGEKMDTDTTFRALRPAALDELADEGHARRRDTDLARAMNSAAEARPRVRRRRPALLAAGVAAAACAAGGAIVATGGNGHTPSPPATAERSVDARTILLAGAETAERAPGRMGRYWYVRSQTRTTHTHEADLPGARPRRPGAGRPARDPKKLPYTFVTTGGEESWTARSPRDRTRTVTGIDVRTSFPTPRDEAEWRRAGSPELLSKEDRAPSVNDYDMPITYQVGNADLTMDELRELPVDAAALGKELRRRYEADLRKAGGPQNVDPYPYFVWVTAQDLLAGPTTPGTKAALYRVLAGQPGVRSDGAVTDDRGRRGAAVSMGGPAGRIRLVIDQKTAELLAYQSSVGKDGDAGLSQTYLQAGWVDSLGERP